MAGDGASWGFFVTGHGRDGAVARTDCHLTTATHIDGDARTYAFDSSQYSASLSGVAYAAGYRLAPVGGAVPLMIPASYGTTFGYTAALVKANAFRLCFDCVDTLDTCSACHNVHGASGTEGATNEAMIRDGALSGRTGFGFSYVVEDTAAGGYPQVTSSGATGATSTGAIFRANTADMCAGSMCHGSPTPPAGASYDATGSSWGTYLEYDRPYQSLRPARRCRTVTTTPPRSHISRLRARGRRT